MNRPNGNDRFKGDEWFGDGIHTAAEWAAERRDTEYYVALLGRSLENGATIAESTLGEDVVFLSDFQRGLPATRDHSRQKQQSKAARYAAWEKAMRRSRGHWTQHADKENTILIHQDSEDPMAGLYIRVRGNLIDAGIYQGSESQLDEASFESLWGKTALNPSDALDFVLSRAMGASEIRT